jgi:hypothetical protein
MRYIIMKAAAVLHTLSISPNHKKFLDYQLGRWNKSPLKDTPLFITDDTDRTFERAGIRKVWELAQDGKYDFIGYWHLKGVTKASNRALLDWRDYMMYFFLQGPGCIIGTGFDSCGVNFHKNPWPHYSGNFWWARREHILTRPEPLPREDRFYWESWLAPSKPLCLHESGVNHYDSIYPAAKYLKIGSVRK